MDGPKKNLGIFIPTPFRSYDRVQSAVWIRALQMIEPLESQGWSVSINNPFKRYHTAIYHRGMKRGSVYAIEFLKKIARRVYWDTCVDYFDEHEACDASQVYGARTIAEIVDGICVPTHGIAKSGLRFNPNVFVMPDPIDLEHFRGRKSVIDLRNPIIGWSGVSQKAFCLTPYSNFLDGRLIIISDRDPRLSFRYRFIRWRYSCFPEDLLRCDVAFLPRLIHSSYTKNNSSFKALVFAVLGIPIIASSLPSYRLLGRHFDNLSFLEEFGDSPEMALGSLAGKSSSPEDVRTAYDRHLWSSRLSQWLLDA